MTEYGLDFVEGDGLERYAGTDLDIRTSLTGMRPDVRERLIYDQVPWGRFHHAYGLADDVPGLLTALRSDDAATAGRALDRLRSAICHQGTTYPSSALAVPFLLRIAGDPATHHRAKVLELPADAARCIMYVVPESRDGLLQIVPSPPRVLFDSGGYPGHWSVEAARDAIARDVHVLLPLLDDPDPELRYSACYVLAAATGESRRVSAAMHERLGVEADPEVRVSLILAIAQLARVRPEERSSAVEWTRACWSGSENAAEVRLGAALAWLCLVDDPVPDDLLIVLDDTITEERSRIMERVPWIRDLPYREKGFSRCLEGMLGPDAQRWTGPNTV